MASLNKVMLIGNLGADPVVRYMPNGDAVANIALATAESWKDKNGEKQEKTEWHRVIFFGRQAEIAGEYLKKGSSIYIEGRLQTRKWNDKDGNERYTTEIVADRMQMLGGRGGSGGGAGGGASFDDGGYSENPAPMQQASAPRESSGPRGGGAPSGGNARPAASKPAPQKPASFDDFEDDIPF